MSIAIVRTEAERALVDAFPALLKELPGPGGWAKIRTEAMAQFAQAGFPNRRVEAFKYTDLRERIKPVALVTNAWRMASKAKVGVAIDPGAVGFVHLNFLDGRLISTDIPADAGHGKLFHFEPLAKAMAGETSAWLEAAIRSVQARGFGPVLALNAAFMSDGVVLRIAAGAKIAPIISLSFATSGQKSALSTTRNVIEVGEGASVTLLESHVGMGAAGNATNSATQIVLKNGAQVAHACMIGNIEAATHLATSIADLGEHASYKLFQLTRNTQLARHDAQIVFAGEHATLDISGLMLGRGHEHIDTTLVIDHARANGTSRELFKTVLADEARAVFQGKVIVRPGAQKTDGKQMAQALMLSPNAEFDSKPELEIYADDVACGHGSTVAELDADLMFYCRSRGIPEKEARALLIESFLGDALDRIETEPVKAALAAAASAWLEKIARMPAAMSPAKSKANP